jgi:hypothetical protein
MTSFPRWRLGATLWLMAMAGVLVLVWLVLPGMLARAPHKVPVLTAQWASAAQSGILLLLAVWAGAAWSRKLGLGAPLLEAAWSEKSPWTALAPRLLAGVGGGVAMGVLLLLAGRLAPAPLQALAGTVELPLLVKMLYGGVTEEVLMRWGLMTALLWLQWRLFQRGSGLPRTPYVVCAIVVTAVLFGVGHLPAAAAMGAPMSLPVLAFVIAGNAVPGIVFGALYWRHGIETAITAHALSHVTASALAAL